ncbi:hypothetical protein PROFUN_15726 [Planoprotostelium fungivorum]|uniref:Uncharacterized protein n=1 Tax=Planoprotostelium fungivorum TaxID=1890364 RepID=A0A2P6MUL1_9EUKA|nr:hypothetical protein PROFUN_15726 [Planoprotostelium fungivorum]
MRKVEYLNSDTEPSGYLWQKIGMIWSRFLITPKLLSAHIPASKDLQRQSRLETVLETVSVSTLRRNRDRGVSRPVLSLTKPQDETKTRQTSLVLDRLETVSVLFFLFLGDTRNEPFARPRTKSREGGKDEKNLRLVNKSDLSLSPFDFITHNGPSMSKEGSACKDNAIKNGRRPLYLHPRLSLYLSPSDMERWTTFSLERAKQCTGAISDFNPRATEVYPLPHLGYDLTDQQLI